MLRILLKNGQERSIRNLINVKVFMRKNRLISLTARYLEVVNQISHASIPTERTTFFQGSEIIAYDVEYEKVTVIVED